MATINAAEQLRALSQSIASVAEGVSYYAIELQNETGTRHSWDRSHLLEGSIALLPPETPYTYSTYSTPPRAAIYDNLPRDSPLRNGPLARIPNVLLRNLPLLAIRWKLPTVIPTVYLTSRNSSPVPTLTSSDTDNDGRPDRAELLDGTDPWDSDYCFHSESLHLPPRPVPPKIFAR